MTSGPDSLQRRRKDGIGTAEDVAAVVRLLAGDAAAHVTGRIIRLQSSGVVENLISELV